MIENRDFNAWKNLAPTLIGAYLLEAAMQPQRIKIMSFKKVVVEVTGISAVNKTMAIGAGVGMSGWWAQVN